MRSVRLPILALLACVVAGCATHADKLREVRRDFYANALPSASRALEKELKANKREADVLKLERAIVDLSAGRPKDAERLLREVRDQFDYLEQASVTEAAVSTLTDDTRLAYAGEDYEKVLIRAMLALSNLMCDGSDALAYSLQVGEKQQQIIDRGTDSNGENPKLNYPRVALGPYIHGMLREESHNNFDDVQRSYERVVSWQPGFRPGQVDLARARHGHHSAPGNGVLYVFTLVGKGPYKEEAVEVPTSAALIIASNVLKATGNNKIPPSLAPIKVPKLVLSNNRIGTVLVSVDGQPAGNTETITDVGQLAIQQYDAVYDRVLARAVVRRLIKKGIVYGGKEALGVSEHGLGNLAFDVAGIVWEATEAADTRCWGLLPEKIQVCRVELPAGVHQVTLQPAGNSTPFGQPVQQFVEILNGRNTYLLANFPNDRLVGAVLTSQSPELASR